MLENGQKVACTSWVNKGEILWREGFDKKGQPIYRLLGSNLNEHHFLRVREIAPGIVELTDACIARTE